MFYVHGFLDNTQVICECMDHCPRVGDTMRFAGERYGKVTEVIWCWDEPSRLGQRVNLRIESEAPETLKVKHE